MAANNGVDRHYLERDLERLIKQAEDEKERVTFTVLYLIVEELNVIRSNFFFRLAKFIQQNPRTAGILFAVILVTINLWFVSGFRRPLLIWLGIPSDLVP